MTKYLFVSAFSAFLLISCGAAPVETDTQEQSESVAKEASEAQLVPVGTELAVRNDRSVKITGSEMTESIKPSNEFLTPIEAKGGKLAIVYLTLKNTGSESGNMMFTQFTLVDSQGRQYSELEDFEELVSLNTWLEDKGLAKPEDQLFPSGEAQSARVFRVAPDSEGLQLSVNDKLMAIQ
jgi:hypothetical protein